MLFSTSLRLAAMPVIISASVFGFAHGASAATANTTNCKATAGVNSIVYKVNGKVVSDLRGHVGQGSAVSIDFKIANGCSNVPVNISSYQAPSPVWDPSVADKQVLVGSAVGNFSADGKVHTLNITASNCYYQVDFGTGTPMSHITGTNNQSSAGDLISADNGGTKTCSTTTTTVPVTPTTIAHPTTTTTVRCSTTTTMPKVTTTTAKPTTTTVPKTTTTTGATTVTTVPQATTTTVAQDTTTTAPQVLAETIEPAQVLADNKLAFTGSNSGSLALYGGLLVLIGSALTGLANSIKRRRI